MAKACARIERDAGRAALHDPGLRRRDLRQRVAQERLVIEADRRQDRQARTLDDVRRIEPPDRRSCAARQWRHRHLARQLGSGDALRWRRVRGR
jgi:hypothetical protein